MQGLKLILILTTFIGYSVQKSSISSPTYKAAVTEFHRAPNGTEEEKVADNLAGYINLIKEAQRQDVDILVFPEATLNYYLGPGTSNEGPFRNKSLELATFVPDPALKLDICDLNNQMSGSSNDTTEDYSDFLQKLSCEAKQADLYLVINLVEKSHCTPESQKKINDTRKCAEDGFSLYNTNVVFDRKGRVISRYRKYNLFLEPGLNTTVKAELATFDTDFGVTFGQFICFDIMFYKPAVELTRGRNGLTDFIFPTMWFQQIPFETAIQVQENWAYVNEVNLLAAGASDPQTGSGGSGIYASQKGSLIFSMDPEPVRKILVAEIKKIHHEENSDSHEHKTGKHEHVHDHVHEHEHDNLMIPRENHSPESMDSYKLLSENMSKYTNEKIEFGKFVKKLCHGKFCCQFDLVTTELPVAEGKLSYEYRAVVYNGDVVWGDRTAQIMNCALVSCSGPEIAQCGHKFPDFTKVASRMRITHARVTGEYPKDENIHVVGTSLSYDLTPLDRDRVHVTRAVVTSPGASSSSPSTVKVSAHLHGPPADDLHAFGLYGRDYRKEIDGKSGASLTKTSSLMISTLVFACSLYLLR